MGEAEDCNKSETVKLQTTGRESRRRGDKGEEEWRGGGIMTGEREFPPEAERSVAVGGEEAEE